MGVLYFGPYHREIDAYAHEGYTVRVMPDGTETTTFGGEHGWTGHVGYRARCECGWSGPTVFPVPDPDPMDCPAAEDLWEAEHIAGLVGKARATLWPGWQKRTAAQVASVVGYVESGRFRQAFDVLMMLREEIDTRAATVDELREQALSGGGW